MQSSVNYTTTKTSGYLFHILSALLPTTMMGHGLLWLSCLAVWLSTTAASNLHDEHLFRIMSSPDLPEVYFSSELSQHDVNSIGECGRLCTGSNGCEAAVMNTSHSLCTLHKHAAINTYSMGIPNGLVYIESVCASLATNRPAHCPAAASPVLKDCQEYYEYGYSTSGVYTINPPNSDLDPFDVWCDFFDGHGWTSFQKRFDGSVDFFIYWADYKNGFGSVDGEQWMGNDRIHALTQSNQKLNIYMEAADGTFRNGYWTQFYISDESDNYRLTVTEDGYSGDAEEQLASNHNGMPFSTRDRDNDNSGSNCASSYTGAWWYNSCHSVNLNGIYTSNGVSHSGAAGVNWCCDWKGHSDSLLKTTMRLTRD